MSLLDRDRQIAEAERAQHRNETGKDGRACACVPADHRLHLSAVQVRRQGLQMHHRPRLAVVHQLRAPPRHCASAAATPAEHTEHTQAAGRPSGSYVVPECPLCPLVVLNVVCAPRTGGAFTSARAAVQADRLPQHPRRLLMAAASLATVCPPVCQRRRQRSPRCASVRARLLTLRQPSILPHPLRRLEAAAELGHLLDGGAQAHARRRGQVIATSEDARLRAHRTQRRIEKRAQRA